MKLLVALSLIVLLAACSRVTQENFAQIETGMTEQEVVAVLGRPSESSSSEILGVSGTVSKWVGRDAEITIKFVNGKVVTRRFDKPK